MSPTERDLKLITNQDPQGGLVLGGVTFHELLMSLGVDHFSRPKPIHKRSFVGSTKRTHAPKLEQTPSKTPLGGRPFPLCQAAQSPPTLPGVMRPIPRTWNGAGAAPRTAAGGLGRRRVR